MNFSRVLGGDRRSRISVATSRPSYAVFGSFGMAEPKKMVRDSYVRHVSDGLGKLTDQELGELERELRSERLRRSASSRSCLRCGHLFLTRAGAMYCTGRCRTAAYRHRLTEAA
jgi:hypothetical protein